MPFKTIAHAVLLTAILTIGLETRAFSEDDKQCPIKFPLGSQEDIDAASNLMSKIRSIWVGMQTKLGYTGEARQKTLEEIRNVKGVCRAYLSQDGSQINYILNVGASDVVLVNDPSVPKNGSPEHRQVMDIVATNKKISGSNYGKSEGWGYLNKVHIIWFKWRDKLGYTLDAKKKSAEEIAKLPEIESATLSRGSNPRYINIVPKEGISGKIFVGTPEEDKNIQ